MTEIQQIEFNKLKSKVDDLGELMSKMSSKTDVIYFALVGNDLTKDGGLVQQIKDMEEYQKKFEKDINEKFASLEKGTEKRLITIEGTITKWKGIAIGLFISGGVVGYLLQIIITNFKK